MHVIVSEELWALLTVKIAFFFIFWLAPVPAGLFLWHFILLVSEQILAITLTVDTVRSFSLSHSLILLKPDWQHSSKFAERWPSKGLLRPCYLEGGGSYGSKCLTWHYTFLPVLICLRLLASSFFVVTQNFTPSSEGKHRLEFSLLNKANSLL